MLQGFQAIAAPAIALIAPWRRCDRPGAAPIRGESSTGYRQPWGLNVRSTVAGYWRRASGGRTGRRSKFPPQFGHLLCRRPLAQSAQNVHSKEQIMTSRESGGRSRLQHSQFGFMSNIGPPTIQPGFGRSYFDAGLPNSYLDLTGAGTKCLKGHILHICIKRHIAHATDR